MKRWLMLVAFFMLATVLVACGNNGKDEGQEEKPAEEVSTNESSSENQDNEEDAASENADQPEVETAFRNADEEEVGTAKLMQTSQGVEIKLDLHNLPPGVHGFHFHEKGDCQAPDFKSAGDHFNPTNKKHGVENPEGPHAGDLPNLTIDEDGKLQEEVRAEMVTLEKGLENSLLKEGGTALIIHKEADDNKSQPAGNAGDRIACAEIK